MAGTPIDYKSVSFEKILQDLQRYVQSLPDYARWKDFYRSSAGTTFLELLAGAGAYLSFHSINARRESYLDTATLKSSVYNIATTLGYEPNRKTAPVFRIHLLKDSRLYDNYNGFTWPYREVPIATYEGYNLVTMDTITVTRKSEMAGKVFDICMGDWSKQEFTVEETKPFLKLFVTDNGIDNSLDHIAVVVKQAGNSMATTPLKGVRFAEEMVPPDSAYKVLIRSTYDGAMLVFGDGTFGYKVGAGDIVQVNYLSTVGRPAVSVSTESLREAIQWTGDASWIAEFIDYIEVLSPGYADDSLDKLKSIASGYFAAKRRMLTVADHNAVLMSYPDVISAGTQRKGYGDGQSCCIVQMCPLFEDEHVVNSEDRDTLIQEVTVDNGAFKFIVAENYDLRLFSGGYSSNTVQYPNINFKLVSNAGSTGELTNLSQYPVYYVISDITERKVTNNNGTLVVTPASFKIKDPATLEYIGGDTAPTWKNATLYLCASDYLAQDRSVGGPNRSVPVTEWGFSDDLAEPTSIITLAAETDLVDGDEIGFAFGGQLLADGSGVCLPDPLMTTLLTNPYATWTIQRIPNESLQYRLLDSEGAPVTLTKYVVNRGSSSETEVAPHGTVFFKWLAGVDSSPIVSWNTEDNTLTIEGNTTLEDNTEVWFSGIDPDLNTYLHNTPGDVAHLSHHDPIAYGGVWNKPWARATRGNTFVPLWLPPKCYEYWHYAPTGNGPRFHVRLKPGTTHEYYLYDNTNTRLTLTHAGEGACWLSWYKDSDKNNYGTREQQAIMKYLEDMKVAGEVIELVDPVKVILQMKLSIVVADSVTVSELEEQVTNILYERIRQLGKTFKPGEVVTEISKLPGVLRVYLKYPTMDKELKYNQYIGFDKDTYLDKRIREAIFGDVNHYIAPLDLNITTNENTVVDMVPDATKGYYEEE